jgi:hypothetical protein
MRNLIIPIVQSILDQIEQMYRGRLLDDIPALRSPFVSIIHSMDSIQSLVITLVPWK